MRVHREKNFRVPLKAWLLYILLCTVAITGVTLSKYVTMGTATDSARVVKMGDISITETGDFNADGKLILVPGVILKKEAVVEFDGSETACYVFLTSNFIGSWSSTDNLTFSAAEGKISWGIADGWNYLTTETDGTYVYYQVLEPNTALEQSKIIKGDIVKVDAELTASELAGLSDGSGLSITFGAVAVQSEGYADLDHIKSAWDSVKTK